MEHNYATFPNIKDHFETCLHNTLYGKIPFNLIEDNYEMYYDISYLKYDFIGENGRHILEKYYENSDMNPGEITLLVKKINYLILMHYLYWHCHLDSIKKYFEGNQLLCNLIGNVDLMAQSDIYLMFKMNYNWLESIPIVVNDTILLSETKNINTLDEDSFESIAQSQIDLYKKKKSDYGSATDKLFQKYGFEYYQIMLEQKMQRIDSLTKKDNKHNFESLEDTLLDLSNYAILAVESLRKQKKTTK